MKRLADLGFDLREEVDVVENTLQQNFAGSCVTSNFLFVLPSMVDDDD